MPVSRRDFLQTAGAASLGLIAPVILTPRRVRARSAQGTLAFRPYLVQEGRGPHLADFAYASDAKWDAFHSNITASPETGVVISDTEGQARFGVNPRWNVSGFGYVFLTADDGGDLYELPPAGETRELNLNYELAKSRVVRNRSRFARHTAGGWSPSRALQGFIDLSEGYYEDAGKAGDELRRAVLSQEALTFALWSSEMLELEFADHVIGSRAPRERFFVGCDARSFYQMDPDLFLERFAEVFNYATITHYLVHNDMPDFEPTAGAHQFDTRDVMLDRLRAEGITVEGRPLFYPYKTITPDWLRHMKYDDLLRYVEKHVREVVGHYGDRMYAWEVVNEIHDWANEVRISPEQSVEVTRLACDVARDTAPDVHRLINNCCPFAEYVQDGKWNEIDAIYPQRTPWEFLRDLVDADVDFTITGQQMYFPGRDLQDIVMMIERYEQFGRPVQLTEVGTTSGPSRRSILDGSLGFPEEPYEWHRPWDEELQADWLESVYTLAYSKPWIEAVNWYDFMDGKAWIPNGGLIAGQDGQRKEAFVRLERWTERLEIGGRGRG